MNPLSIQGSFTMDHACWIAAIEQLCSFDLDDLARLIFGNDRFDGSNRFDENELYT
jgi:hypothetical protein